MNGLFGVRVGGAAIATVGAAPASASADIAATLELRTFRRESMVISVLPMD
jgi:hypothetical protein